MNDIDINIRGNTNGYKSAADEAKKVTNDLGSTLTEVGRLSARFLVTGSLLEFSRTAIVTADNMNILSTRLRAVVGESDDLTKIQAELFKSAQQNSIPLESLTRSYIQLSQSAEVYGISSEQTIRINDLVAKSLRLSGATAEEAGAAMLQFTQAFGSGVLQGDEFKSLKENAPILIQNLAKGIGVTVGELRNMSEQGQLTTSVIVKSLQKMGTEIDAQAGKLDSGISGALTRMGNSFASAIADMNSKTQTTQIIAGGINGITSAVDTLRSALNGKFNWANMFTGLPAGLIQPDGSIQLKVKGPAANFGVPEKGPIAQADKYTYGLPSMKDEAQQFEALNRAIAAYANDSKFFTKTQLMNKEILEQAKAFKDLTENVVDGSPQMLEARKALDAHIAQIQEKYRDKSHKTEKTDPEIEDVARLINEVQKRNSLEENQTQILADRVAMYSTKLGPALTEYLNLQLQQINNTEQLIAFQQAFNQGIDNQIESDNELYQADKQLADERLKVAADLAQSLEEENQNLNISLIQNDRDRSKAQIEIDRQRQIERINAQVLDGEASVDLIDKVNQNAELRLKGVDQQLFKTKDLVKEVGLTFQSAFEKSVTSGAKVSDMLQGLAKDLLALAARKTVTEPLLSAFSDIFSGFDFGSIFSSSAESAVGQHFVNGVPVIGDVFDNLNSFDIGTSYVTHDQIAKIHKGEQIVKPGQVSTNGQINPSVSITINTDGSRNESSNQSGNMLGDFARELEGAVNQIIFKHMRPGGVLAKS